MGTDILYCFKSIYCLIHVGNGVIFLLKLYIFLFFVAEPGRDFVVFCGYPLLVDYLFTWFGLTFSTIPTKPPIPWLLGAYVLAWRYGHPVIA